VGESLFEYDAAQRSQSRGSVKQTGGYLPSGNGLVERCKSRRCATLLNDMRITMQVDFEPEALTTMIRLWQADTDMEVPMADEFKVHMMVNRRKILQSHVATAKAWTLFFMSLSTDGDDAGLEIVKAQVENFKLWAEASLLELEAL
jgi:hypothetical protein